MATRQKNAPPVAPQVNGHDAEADIELNANAGEGNGDAPEIIEGDATSGDSADEGIEALRQQLADEKRRREEAEAAAATLRNQSQQQQREVVDNRMLVLDATIQRQEGEKANIIAELKAAKERGDYDAEAAATDKLSQINIDLKQTKLGKSRLEADLEDGGGQEQQRQTTQQRSSGDPLEDFIAQNRLHPRAGNWLRNHRDYAEDPVKNAELTRAHHLALRSGAALNSDAYYEALETELGLRQAPDDDGGQQEQRQPPPRSNGMPPAAPPSRAGGMGGGGREIMQGITDLGNGKYRTTPAIRQFAESIGMTVQEYVAQAVALKNEGQIH